MASDCVEDGVTSIWKFDQKQKKIDLIKTQSSEVCHAFTNQLNANFEIQFLKKETLVHKMKIFWSDITFGDEFKDDKLTPIISKTIDFKILKLPVSKKDIDRFKVYSLDTNTIVSRGEIK